MRAKLGSLSSEALAISKTFLLDVIAESKLPDSLEPYLLTEQRASRSRAAKAKLIVEEDDLPPRATPGKRQNPSDSLTALEPVPAKVAHIPGVTSPTRAPVASSTSSGVAAGVQKGAGTGGKVETPLVAAEFPVLPSAVASNTTVQAKYSALAVPMKWETVGGSCLAYSSPSISGSPLMAAFDMDSTLIVPKSGAKFPANRGDWRWMWPEVTSMLKRLHGLGYKIVIFSNQNGISKGKQNQGDITGKIQDMCANIDLPIQAFCASAGDKYRKPSPEMFRLYCQKYNGGVEVDLTKSFYIGDAAGRPINWAPKKKADHGAGDRKFAANARLPFQTPEEFFLQEDAVAFHWRTIDPSEVLSRYESANGAAQAKVEAFNAVLKSIGHSQELILMIGIPASGKSTFAIRYLESKGYVRANRDLMGTMPKCLAAVKAALSSGKSAVVDNTNPSTSAREPFISLAKKSGVRVRALFMETPETLADHCNLFRERFNGTKRIPDIAYNMYRKNFEAPSKTEGFDEVLNVPWIPKFDSASDRSLFLEWTE